MRPIWALEELGLPYAIVPVDFSAEYRRTPEWRKMNPVGKVPAMTDGDLTMFESVAMMQYILDRYGGGRLQPTAGTPCDGALLLCCLVVLLASVLCLLVLISTCVSVHGCNNDACLRMPGVESMRYTCSGVILLRRLLPAHLAKWSTTAENSTLHERRFWQRWPAEVSSA